MHANPFTGNFLMRLHLVMIGILIYDYLLLRMRGTWYILPRTIVIESRCGVAYISIAIKSVYRHEKEILQNYMTLFLTEKTLLS